MRYQISVLLVLLLLLPGVNAETGAANSGITASSDTVSIEIISPENDDVMWIDVVPPHGIIEGRVKTPGILRSITAFAENRITDCGNQTYFICEIPVSAGDQSVLITATDSTGTSVSETVRFTVKIGMPPPHTMNIHGKITNPEGLPIAGTIVRAESSFTLDNIPISVTTTSDSDGTYLIENATGASQKISFQKEGYVTQSREIVLNEGSNELDVVMKPPLNFLPGFTFVGAIAAIIGFSVVVQIRKRKWTD